MYNAVMVKKEQKKICDICGDIGQVSYFNGVSRFLISTEECSKCAGIGYELDSLRENKGGQTERKCKAKKNK